jgi:hypothetical protein
MSEYRDRLWKLCTAAWMVGCSSDADECRSYAHEREEWLDRLDAENTAKDAERDQLRAENARLRAALQPFAEAGNMLPWAAQDEWSLGIEVRTANSPDLTCKHLRDAHAALEAPHD